MARFGNGGFDAFRYEFFLATVERAKAQGCGNRLRRISG
jgi:hypothetical protein